MFLAFLLTTALSNWRTNYLGRPLLSRAREEELLLYTQENYLAKLDKNTGDVLWRNQLEKVLAIDLSQDVALAATKYYFYVFDRDSGLFLHHFKHPLGKTIKEINSFNKTIILRNETHLANYELKDLTWIIDFDDQTAGINITESAEIFCGTCQIENSTGAIIKRNLQPYKYEFVDIHYHPTVIESYGSDGNFLWNISEPLYGADLLFSFSRSIIALKNSTHFIVYNLLSEQIDFVFTGKVINSFHNVKGFFFEVENDGVYQIFPPKWKVVKYKKTVYSGSYSNGTIRMGPNQIVLPKNCELKCSAVSPNGYTLAVSECHNKNSGNEESSINAIVIDHAGKIKYSHNGNNLKLGTCWSQDDYLALSLGVRNKEDYFVQSFMTVGANIQHSVSTRSLVVAADGDRCIYANGEHMYIPKEFFHPTLCFKGKQPGFIQNMMEAGNGFNEYMWPKQIGAYRHVKKIVAENHCIILQEGSDIVAIEGAANSNTMSHVCFIAGLLCLALIMFYNAFASKKDTFWR